MLLRAEHHLLAVERTELPAQRGDADVALAPDFIFPGRCEVGDAQIDHGIGPVAHVRGHACAQPDRPSVQAWLPGCQLVEVTDLVRYAASALW